MDVSKSITVSKRRNLVLGIVFLTLTLGIVATWFYFNSYSKRYNKPSFDTSAVEGKANTPEELKYSELKLSDNYNIGVCGEPSANNEGIDLYFSNLEGNDVLLKCLLLDSEEKTIGESGVIPPNSYVKTIKFSEPMSPGEHELIIKVIGYEPETYYSKGTANLVTRFKIS